MNKPRNALLGACLALPFLCAAGSASAAPPASGHYIYIPAGATVVLLPAAVPPPVAVAPMAVPVASLIAEQQAMMQQMIAQMNAMFAMPMPDPQQLMQAAMRGMPQTAPGSSVMLTAVGSGNGMCSETITYAYPPNGGAPVVHVTHSGDGCGRTFNATGPAHIKGSPAVQRGVPARPAGAQPRLWTAGDPPHLIGTDDPRS